MGAGHPGEYSIGSAGPSLTKTPGNHFNADLKIYYNGGGVGGDLDGDSALEHYFVFSFDLTAYANFVSYMNTYLKPSSPSVDYEALVA